MKRPFPTTWLQGNWETRIDSGGYYNGWKAPEWDTFKLRGTWTEACVPHPHPLGLGSSLEGGLWRSLAPAELAPTRDPCWVLVDFGDSFLRYRLRELSVTKAAWESLSEGERERRKLALRSSNVISSLLADLIDSGTQPQFQGHTKAWTASDEGAAEMLLAKVVKCVTDSQLDRGGYEQRGSRREDRHAAEALLPLLEAEIDSIARAAKAKESERVVGSIWEEPAWKESVRQRLLQWSMDRGWDPGDIISVGTLARIIPTRRPGEAAAYLLARAFGESVSMGFLVRGERNRTRTLQRQKAGQSRKK